MHVKKRMVCAVPAGWTIRAARSPAPVPSEIFLTAEGASEFCLLAAEGGDTPEQKLRRFTMTAYTGAAMRFPQFLFPVVVDLAGLTVPSKGRPILRDHQLSQIVGHTTSIDAGDRNIKLAGVISGANDAAREVIDSAANGFPWEASIGASVQKMVFVDDGEKVVVNGRTFKGPLYVARQATLKEISFVAIGADDGTAVKVAATSKSTVEVLSMPFEEWVEAQGFTLADLSAAQTASLRAMYDAQQEGDDPAPAGDAEEVIEASADPESEDDEDEDEPEDPIVNYRTRMAAERQRIAAIGTLCDGRTDDIEVRAIQGGWGAQRTELEILRGDRPRAPAGHSRGREQDGTLQAMQAGMILRFGGRLDSPVYQRPAALSLRLPQWLRASINDETRQRAMEWGHRYGDLSAIDLCREALRLDGRDAPLGRAELIQAAFSGSALTNIFTTSVNARLLTTYGETTDTTGGWTSETDVADFKTNERPRMSKGPNLEKLPRGGEADHYDRSDLVESYKIARYAKQFVVDEQDVIDDSMHALNEMPVEMGLAAARLRPDLVYAIILRNAALGADGLALFLAATHANLNTTAALTSATLKTAIAALEKQRENGVNLNLRATHLIVPSDLKHTAAELIQSSTIVYGADDETVRGSLNTINAIENLQGVSEARLSNGVDDPVDGVNQAGSTTTWYLASSMGHNIEVAYLRGTGRAPQVRSFVLSQGKYGMGWDVALDIGAKALDYRGMQKNTA